MADHFSIRVCPRDSTTSVFSRGPTGPFRVGSGWPVRKIRSIARTALVAYTTDTINRSTASVPRTICNGPMVPSPARAGASSPTGTDDNRASSGYFRVTPSAPAVPPPGSGCLVAGVPAGRPAAGRVVLCPRRTSVVHRCPTQRPGWRPLGDAPAVLPALDEVATRQLGVFTTAQALAA